ncbi:DNA polymerase III subunit gamma and tau [Kytococcus aerolatus]|uniref:DNA polymerase III subunit gamma and tau n=1 Tax=Kytococcus aerolatus TaxID=592308 RepID=UPI000B58BB42|nr:DNA polymerase III subunit gamma and tau [Kytococcus aerolatus]
MSTALYRRYRPQTFAEVVGQEHVTGPLQQALRSGRVNHAYLFSGPRGCGKTTSARILARCLNCEQGPTDTPCGECPSCRDLAAGGSGSVDVIEIDAASHGGVDDARDLREKASFGPARERYKVYIIDEAHMVTSAGFNALLKIVEEPPEHVLFVFATTEPEKVIGTIRSRTHHYPFRLVPPAVLTQHLQEVCEKEGIAVEPGVLSYVVRAGGGSVRDSMSVLDQLIAGSGDEGITLAGTTALLGFTDAELLDGVVDAYAAGDGASLFTTVERVIDSGQDPRRFVEDLAERMRDLVLVDAVPSGTEAVLPGVPADQLERLRVQASGLGAAELSRASDVLFRGLAEMTGATSARLQLEIIMARLLLPRAAGEQGFASRLEKVERWVAFRGEGPAPAASSVSATAESAEPAGSGAPAAAADAAPAPADRPAPPERVPAQREEPSRPPERPRESTPEPAPQPAPVVEATPAAQPAPQATAPATEQAASGQGGITVEMVRHEWPAVLDRLKNISRVTWAMVAQSMQVQELSAEGLTLATDLGPIAERFNRGDNPQRVATAVQEALGIHPKVRCVVGGGPASAPAGGGPGAAPAAPAVRTGDPFGGPGPMGAGGPSGDDAVSRRQPPQGAPGGDAGGRAAELGQRAGQGGSVGSPEWSDRQDAAPDWASPAPAGESRAPAPAGPSTAAPTPPSTPVADLPEPPDEEDVPPEDFVPNRDDETVESVGMVGTAAIERILGGTIIEEHTEQG